MKKQVCQSKSKYLNRTMEYAVYGDGGYCFIVFPSQNGRFFDFEDQGMVEALTPWIESSKIQLFCVDSNDANSFSDTNAPLTNRTDQMDAYYHYIVDEFYPLIFKLRKDHPKVYTTGCSMGAFHALNFLLRRPDLFFGCICLSGAYDLHLFFDTDWNSVCYENSIVDYLEGMPLDHPYVKLYQDRCFILCSGQGAWEEIMQKDLRKVQELFFYKNIPAFIDFWGNDVIHDWIWWRKQLPYFINLFLLKENAKNH